MPDAIASIATAFSGPAGLGNILKTAVTGSGLLGNFLTQQKQNAALDQELKYQRNPALAAQKIASLEQPLSQGLIQDVGNQTQGYLAERGLSESPQQTTAILGQALGPYQQQQQQTAQQLFESLLNPAGARFQQPTNLAGLFSLFNKNPYQTGSTSLPGGFTPMGTGTPPLPSTTGVDTPPTFGDTFSDYGGIAA